MNLLLVALGFLTRLPVTERASRPSVEELRASVRLFPVVGMLVGALTAAAALGLDRVLPATLAVLLALALEARATGALHEDALADCGDALGGGWTRERVLEIFKDSRLGTYGVLSLGLGLAVRFVATVGILGAYGPGRAAAWIVLAAGAARLAVVAALAWVPPMEGRAGLASEMGRGHGTRHVLLAALPLAPLALYVGLEHPARLAAGLVLAALVAAGFLRGVRRRLGGTTGDVLGACAYVVQLALLVGALLER